MSFLIAGILKRWKETYPEGKVDYKINSVTRVESVGKGTWIECMLDSTETQGVKIHFRICNSSIFVELYDAKTKDQSSNEYLLEKRKWLIKTRQGSGFGILYEIKTWISSNFQDLVTVSDFFKNSFVIGPDKIGHIWETSLENECFDEGFSYEVMYAYPKPFDENDRREDIEFRVTVCSPYEIFPDDLWSWSSFDLFVLFFWLEFPKQHKCIGRDKWACVNCYRSLIEEIWDLPKLPETDPFGKVLE